MDCAHQISEALLKHHHDPARSINRTLDTRKNATMNDKQFQLKLIERGVIYKLLLSVHNGHILHLLPPVGYTWLRGLSSSSSSSASASEKIVGARGENMAQRIGNPLLTSRLAAVILSVAREEIDFAMQQMILPLVQSLRSKSQKLRPGLDMPNN